METEEYQDIIKHEPKIMIAIEDDEVAKYVRDPLYFPIIKALRKGPMTVKEIEKEYNILARNPKSDKTIYRYVKTLEDVGLITVAGQRVVMGKTATETLFARTAYGFYVRNDQADYWYTDNGKNLAEAIGTMWSPLFEDKKLNVGKLQDYFYTLSLNRMNLLKELLEKMELDVFTKIADLDWRKIALFYNTGGLIGVLIEDPSQIDKIRECYE